MTYKPQPFCVTIEDCAAMDETPRALRVIFPGEEAKDLWVPKTFIDCDSYVKGSGQRGALRIARKFADDNNLTSLGKCTYEGP